MPDDVDPAVLVSLIFPYMTAYQLIHGAARAKPGQTREDAIHPVVAERIPLAEVQRAHKMLERTAASGKLVLVPDFQ